MGVLHTPCVLYLTLKRFKLMKKPERLWILMAKKSAGEASAEELEELRRLLSADTSSGYTNEITEKIWDATLTNVPEHNISGHVWERIHAKTASRHHGRRVFTMFRLFAAAAVLIAVVSGGLILFNRFAGAGGDSVAAKNRNQVTTQPGSRSKLELPDGTQVWLNGNSELTYSNGSFGKDDRTVVLTGEAFFDVVKNEKIPFIIQAGPVNITVKGTAFNVKAYPREESIETSLVRGLVEITTDDDPDRKILLKPNEKIIIPVGKTRAGAAVVNNDDSSAAASLFTITKLKTLPGGPAEIAWINPRLVFDNESFAAIAPRMESWFNVHIHFSDEEIKSKRFSGVIENESLRETLEAMQLSGKFSYRIDGNNLWIEKN